MHAHMFIGKKRQKVEVNPLEHEVLWLLFEDLSYHRIVFTTPGASCAQRRSDMRARITTSSVH